MDYNYKERLRKDFNLKILNSPLEELLSYNTSFKYGPKIKEDHNKNIISTISKKEPNNEKIRKLLKMTLSEWIDNIFLSKKMTEDEIKFDGLKLTLMDIMKRNSKDDVYLTRFLFYLYNYQRWFSNKKERKKKTNKKSAIKI